MPNDPTQMIIAQYLAAQLASKKQALGFADKLPVIQSSLAGDISELANLTSRWFIPLATPLPHQYHHGVQIKRFLEQQGFMIRRQNRWPNLYGDEAIQVSLMTELLSRARLKKPLIVSLRQRQALVSLKLQGVSFDPDIESVLARKDRLAFLLRQMTVPGLWATIIARDLDQSAVNLQLTGSIVKTLFLRLSCVEQLELPLDSPPNSDSATATIDL